MSGRYSVGTTDQNGRIVLTDCKLFAYMFEIEDILAVDESGDPPGAGPKSLRPCWSAADLVNPTGRQTRSKHPGAG